ncbi:MAG: hypothetical protein H0X17_13295 [Deltaproteobacteria bacterium]|nr:hypothetical protein [Deltaproteobacteria bacterium]
MTEVVELPLGHSLEVSASGLIAAKVYQDQVYVSEVGPEAPGYFSKLSPSGEVMAYRRSALDPSGQDLFAHAILSSNAFVVRRAIRTGAGTWDVQGSITMKEQDGGLIPGSVASPTAPTVTVPRRMVIARGDRVDDLAEIDPTSWIVVRSTSAAELGVASVIDAHLDPSGRRLIFHGRSVDDLIHRVFVSEREAIERAFSSARVLYDSAEPPVTPFLTADCQRLYFTRESNQDLQRVSFASGT